MSKNIFVFNRNRYTYVHVTDRVLRIITLKSGTHSKRPEVRQRDCCDKTEDVQIGEEAG